MSNPKRTVLVKGNPKKALNSTKFSISISILIFIPTLDESGRGEWKSWLKTQHSEN